MDGAPNPLGVDGALHLAEAGGSPGAGSNNDLEERSSVCSDRHVEGSASPCPVPSQAPLASSQSALPSDRHPLGPSFLGGASSKEALQQLSMLVRQQQQVLQHSQRLQQQQQQQQQHLTSKGADKSPSQTPSGRMKPPSSTGMGSKCEEASSREALHRALQLSRDLAAAALEIDLDDAYSWCE